jgi:solute carrier family 25 phosphate transporter 23/24/25/41
MSSTGGELAGNRLIARIAADMWRNGGIRLYFKGLTAGLIGVFPYSAIDMSTFEGIKMTYTKWSGHEPGIPGSLAFGACSGGIGATSEQLFFLFSFFFHIADILHHIRCLSTVRSFSLSVKA